MVKTRKGKWFENKGKGGYHNSNGRDTNDSSQKNDGNGNKGGYNGNQRGGNSNGGGDGKKMFDKRRIQCYNCQKHGHSSTYLLSNSVVIEPIESIKL
jgi:hypothetical protein